MLCLTFTHHWSQVIINNLCALTLFASFLGRWVLQSVILAFVKMDEELPGM